MLVGVPQPVAGAQLVEGVNSSCFRPTKKARLKSNENNFIDDAGWQDNFIDEAND
jgi:hypothetical protein